MKVRIMISYMLIVGILGTVAISETAEASEKIDRDEMILMVMEKAEKRDKPVKEFINIVLFCTKEITPKITTMTEFEVNIKLCGSMSTRERK